MQNLLNEYSLNIKQAIQWGDMDALGHVNNCNYFRYFENSRINYFEQTKINAYMSKNNIGPILGTTECKYLAPLVWLDNIQIATRVSAIREKRFTMDYLIVSEKLKRKVAVGSGEIIYYNFTINQTEKIPAKIIENIKAFESQTV